MVALAAGTLTSCAYAQVNNPEIEANETKATATVAASGGAGMANGDTISGNTTGTSTTVAGATSADIFRVKTAARPLGIYRHRLALTTTGTAGHIGTILGLTQSATGIGTAVSPFQTSSTTTAPGRMNQWYGFGKQEEIYYRVTGTTSTTADYTATLETVPVTVTTGPTLPPGNVLISSIGQTTVDTDLWVYDANLDAIAGFGNDDESIAGGGTGVTAQSRIQRSMTPGTYYLAVGRYNTANNQATPADDDWRTGPVLDFPNAISSSSATAPTAISISIGGQVVSVTDSDPYSVQFISFTVAQVLSGGCPAAAQTAVEGEIATISVVTSGNPGVPVTGVTVDASSINPSATSVALSDTDGDGTWTGTVLATVQASATPFALSYVVRDASNATANGSCNITITASASGACCLPAGCSILTQYGCSLQSGTFNGAGSNCGGLGQGNGTSTFTSIASTGTDLSATPKTSGTDDDGRWTLTLPFPVNYAGVPATEISVCTNGFIQFGPGPVYSTEYVNAAIPAATDPDNMVCALWDDLTVSPVARIYTQTAGTPGSQTFTVSFENYRQLGATTDNFNFQFVLTENSNVVEVVYGSMAPAISGTDFTVGAENFDGSGGVNVDPALIGSGGVSFTYSPTGNPCETAGCDDIDFNNNGVFPEDQDVIDFFDVLAGGTPATCDPVAGCNDIDFNNNEVFPEDQDVIDFFNVLAGGECP
jgi:hypothetical protein